MGMDRGEYEFSVYNRKAEEVICRIAREHAGWDVFIGAFGTLASIVVPVIPMLI
jgi:hypothetical protein